MGALIQRGAKTRSTKVSWHHSAQAFSVFAKDLTNLEARGEVLKGRCPPWAQDPCSDGSVYLWSCGSFLQGSKFGLTKLLSCDNGQFFVQFGFKCPRWWWGVTLWMVRAHWWENMCSGEDNWGAQSVFMVFQSLPRNGCLKDMRNIGKTKRTPLLH